MYEIETCVENGRGCGFRRSDKKTGVGLYLVGGGGDHMHCDRVPFVLTGENGDPQKHFRGYKEINPQELFADNLAPLRLNCTSNCIVCPMGGLKRNYALLMFVGKEHYPTPEDFLLEAHQRGPSKRIQHIPEDFIFGQHWLYLAHIEAGDGFDEDGQPCKVPAVFYAYMPKLDLVVDSADPSKLSDKAKALKDKYGQAATLKKVVPV